MAKVLTLLIAALIALGFLISNTISLIDENKRLKAENRHMNDELANLQVRLQESSDEAKSLSATVDGMKIKLDVLTQAYLAEYQAHQSAVAELEELSREFAGSRRVDGGKSCASDSRAKASFNSELYQFSPVLTGSGLLGFLLLTLLTRGRRKPQK